MNTMIPALALACTDLMAFQTPVDSVSIAKARCRLDGVSGPGTGAGGRTYAESSGTGDSQNAANFACR